MKLYDLEADVGETTDMAQLNPDVVQRLLGLAEKARADLGDLNHRGNQRRAGWVVTPVPLNMNKMRSCEYIV